jgi:hypothetical protein
MERKDGEEEDEVQYVEGWWDCRARGRCVGWIGLFTRWNTRHFLFSVMS